MAQSGFTPIQLFRTTTAAAVPTAGDLAAGELAINLTDEALYFKNAAGVVTLLADSSGALGTVTSVDVSGGTTGLTTSGGPITSSGTITLAGTLGVANGGTGATTFTANGVVYGNTTSALLVTAAGTTGQVLVGNTGGAPSWATLSGIGVTSFSAGTTGLTPNTATTGVVTLAGTLGVANGGTGTATAFTAGSVVFAGASGVYSQDNANLFWDNANDRLGIGTASPAALLHVNVAGGSATSGGYRLSQLGYTSQFGYWEFDSVNDRFKLGVNGITQPLTFDTNSTERMRITTAGDVGIGTSSPSQRLDVTVSSGTEGDGLAVTNLFTSGGSGGYGSGINFFSVRSDGTTKLGSGAIRMFGAASWSDAGSTSSNMRFYTVNANTLAERMRIDASGNVGIGVVPSAWSAFKALQVDHGALSSTAVGNHNVSLSANAYFDGSNWRYIGSSFATELRQNGGAFQWYQAPSGTAGDAISFTQAMTLNSSGNLIVGGTSDGFNGRVATIGSGAFVAYAANNNTDTNFTIRLGATAGNVALRALPGGGAGSISFEVGDAGSERMRIDSSGNVVIGSTSAIGNFSVVTPDGGSTRRLAVGHQSGYPSLFSRDSDGTTVTSGFWDAQQQIFTNAGTERMRIDSSGNVGIGTSSPAARLNVEGTARMSQPGATRYRSDWYLETGGVNINGFDDTGLVYIPVAFNFSTYTFNSSATERMRIDASGNLLVGATTAVQKLTIGNSSSASSGINLRTTKTDFNIEPSNSDAGGVVIAVGWVAGGQGPMRFDVGGEKARIDSSGNLLVGKTAVDATVVGAELAASGRISSTLAGSTNATSTLEVYSTGAAAYRFFVDMGGTVNATSATISAISDIRLKENVRDLDAGLDTILALKPRRFDWKEGKGKDVRDDMGFIAQEVETVLPELVGGWKAGEGEPDDLKSIKAGDLIPVLVKAIQELTARVAQLEGN
jgi:hypothetical protein